MAQTTLKKIIRIQLLTLDNLSWKKNLMPKEKLLRNNIMRISATITDTQTHTQTTFYHYQFEKKKYCNYQLL